LFSRSDKKKDPEVVIKVGVRNLSVSLSSTFIRNEKVKHYIRIKIHKSITLKFWIESDVNALCD